MFTSSTRPWWTAAGYGPGQGHKVGVAFANDADGTAWYEVFTQKVAEDGYELVDPGQYPAGTTDFSNVISQFKSAEIDVLAGTNTPPDFSNLWSQALQSGLEVGCVTMASAACCWATWKPSARTSWEGVMTEVCGAPITPIPPI